MAEEIPQEVIEALAAAKESGRTNMFDYQAVCFYVEMGWDFKAYEWLIKNRPRYMEALNVMGAARKAGA